MSDAMKHTPGPWEWHCDGYGDHDLVHFTSADRSTYERIHSDGSGANARLIAAAPDLLAACKAAMRYDVAIMHRADEGKSWVQGEDLDTLYEDWIDKATAAIAKAEG